MASTNEEKSAFVSGGLGTRLTEIFCIISILPLTQLMHLAFHRVHGLFQKNKFAMFMYDHTICALPIILLSTIASDWIMRSVVIGYGIALGLLYSHTSGKNYKEELPSNKEQKAEQKPHFISNYKASAQLATAVCILAVDFPAFPRRFAKAEVYGSSPMDVMVGIMIFSMAFTSSDAKYIKDDHKRSFFSRVNSFMMECHVTAKKTFPLLVLGLMRIVLVKRFNYHEHVTEYGAHWNFFITVAAVNLVSRPLILLCRTVAKNSYAGFSFATIVCHQVMLSYFGVYNIIQKGTKGDGSRDTLVDANREGIFSTVGYTAIYFGGVYCGRLSLKLHRPSFMRIMCIVSVVCWGGLTMVLDARFKKFFLGTDLEAFFTPVSRQMANLSYYLLIIAVNTQLLASFLLADSFSETLKQKYQRPSGKNEKPGQGEYFSNLIVVPWLYESVSRYQLVYFLLANLGTGLVNMYLVDTLRTNDIVSVLILNGYVLLLNGIVYCVIRPYSKDRKKED